MGELNQLSEALLLAVKSDKFTRLIEEKLAGLQLSELKSDLSNDTLKKAFWINIYNSFYQLLSRDNNLHKSKIYVSKAIAIANLNLSLDEIEHGILRKYRYKYSLGYFANPFVSRHIQLLAVSAIDFRIHFALNCGAVSCPPISFYSSDLVDSQLEAATISFLETETEVRKDSKEIYVSRLLKWFIGDFGGKKGIRIMLQNKLNIDSAGFRIVYKPYSWEEHLSNYSENSFNLQEKKI